jgi:hypothetical protein
MTDIIDRLRENRLHYIASRDDRHEAANIIEAQALDLIRATEEIIYLEKIKEAAQALSDSMKPSMQVQGEKMYCMFEPKLVGDLRKLLREYDG